MHVTESRESPLFVHDIVHDISWCVQGRDAEAAVKDAQAALHAAQQAVVASKARHQRAEEASSAACRLAAELRAKFKAMAGPPPSSSANKTGALLEASSPTPGALLRHADLMTWI